MDLIFALASFAGVGLALVAILLLFGIFLRLGRIALYVRRLTEQQHPHGPAAPQPPAPTLRPFR